MKSLVIYDSNFGNSKQIAETVADTLHTKALSIANITNGELEGLDLLVVGSPINGWQPTERMRNFLAALQKTKLQGTSTATFDTRVQLFIHGDAAGKIASVLEELGAENISTHGFRVKGVEGPLLEGEIERAKQWAQEVRELYHDK